MDIAKHNTENIVLIGGSRLLAELSLEFFKTNKNYYSFTSKRQLNDPIEADGTTLKDFFQRHNLILNISDDINSDSNFIKVTEKNSLVIGLGQSWKLTIETLKRLENRVFDFMGIDLPRFRGGAHYSWQILMGNKNGACHFELIDEFTEQGKTDSGIVIMSEKYKFPDDCRIPIDYFNFAVNKEKQFILRFINEVSIGKNFKKSEIDNQQSTYFPRLKTTNNGFIDWNSKIVEIEKFICAFDSPYFGAITYLKNKKVHIKSAFIDEEDINFHPFQRGLIFRSTKSSIFVCCFGGALRIEEVIYNGENIVHQIEIGERLYTPTKTLEKALKIENEL